MTEKPQTPSQPEKQQPAAPPSPAEIKGGTQRLNEKPPSKLLDAETQERLKKLLADRRQAKGDSEPTGKLDPVPALPADSAKPEDKEPPSQPAPPAANSAQAKVEAWPEPPKSLGEGQSSPPQPAKPAAPAPSAPPKAAAAAQPEQPSQPPAATPGGETSQLNRQPANPPAATASSAGSSGRTGLLNRLGGGVKAGTPTKTTKRDTGEVRAVPKGRIAREVWKVIIQGVAGSEVKATSVEVKGLTVIGRLDPDSDAKPDIDLTAYEAKKYGVSRQHAILFPTEEGPSIIDLNSTNGTWINGLYLEPGRKYRLNTGDRLELGSLKVLLRIMSPAEQATPTPPSDPGSTAEERPKPKPDAEKPSA